MTERILKSSQILIYENARYKEERKQVAQEHNIKELEKDILDLKQLTSSGEKNK